MNKRKEIKSSRIPVYRDAGFELSDASTAKIAFAKENDHRRDPEHYIYSRYRNPTVVSAEEEIMKLEDCKWALLTQSGMSAIDTALSIFQNGKETKSWLFFSEIYGGTLSYIESVLRKRRGLEINYFTPANGEYDLAALDSLLSELRPELVFIESVSNPMLIVTDISRLVLIAKKHGTRVIVDNTFATPFLCKPLYQGADIVIHSATKYLSGHGNLTAGILCGNDEMIGKSAVEYRKLVGHCLSPDDAYRLQSHLQSFELRFSRQCSSASKLAEFLNKYNFIKRVLYPGLKSHKTHSAAYKLFRGKGFGAMLTFDFDGQNNIEKIRRRDVFIKEISDKIKLIPTLGDPRTILMPVEAVWGDKYPEPGMIRLSVGFEEYDDIESTIKKGMDAVAMI